MKKHIIIQTIAAAIACSATFADEQEKEVVKSQTNNGEATANAVAKGTSTTTTNINGKSVTIMEDLDENGKKRIRMITYENGKPKVKDITPKEKEQAKKEEDPFWKKKPAGGAEEKRTTAVGTSSNSSSSSSHTDGSGNTVTTTTTERDGKRETRRTVTGPDGKVLSETTGDGNTAANPAAEKGKPGGPWLGVHTTEVPPAMREQLDIPAESGLLVEQLPPDSPAASAGIAQHDILLTLNLTPVATPEQLRAELAKFQPGEKVLVEYLHKARREKAAVTLSKRGNPETPNTVPQAGNTELKTASVFPGGTAKASAKSSTRTVIVGSDGKAKVIETDGNGDPFENMLRDPNVPATMKESVRKVLKMQEQMRDLHKGIEDAAPGNGNAAGKETQ